MEDVAASLLLLTSGSGQAETEWLEQAGSGYRDLAIVTTGQPADGTGAIKAGQHRPELGDGLGLGASFWVGLWLTAHEIIVVADHDRLRTMPQVGDLRQLVAAFDDPEIQVAIARPANPTDDVLTNTLVRGAITLHHPHLADLADPRPALWAVRRDHIEMLPSPIGEGAELAALLDTDLMYGRAGIAEVETSADWGAGRGARADQRAAVQLLTALERRLPQRLPFPDDSVQTADGLARVDEAPPVSAVPGYLTQLTQRRGVLG